MDTTKAEGFCEKARVDPMEKITTSDGSWWRLKDLLDHYLETDSLRQDNERMKKVLEKLCFLNSCEEEGLSSGMPTAKEWREAFEGAQRLLDKN